MLQKTNQQDTPRAPKDLINQLITLYQQGQYQQTLEQGNQLLQQYPQTPPLHNILGATYSILGQPEHSVHHLREALNLQPHYPDAYNNLGAVLNDLGQYQEAQQLLEQAIQIKPGYAEAHNNLGNVLLKLQEYEKAKGHYAKAVEINPQYAEAYNNLGTAFSHLENYDKAIENFHYAISLNPQAPEAHNNLGLLHYDLCKYEEAINIFENILASYPNNYEATRNIVFGLLALGRNEEATTISYKALKLDSSSLTSRINLIELSGFNSTLDFEGLFADFCKGMDEVTSVPTSDQEMEEVPMVALTGFGRAGSLFLHSLIDGHPNVATLPGYFFKGWFGEGAWKVFTPNINNPHWRELLASTICDHFEPQFNAHSKKNVIGRPNDHTDWLADNLGFTKMGSDHSETLHLDQELFKNHLVQLLQPYEYMNQKICLALIHKAFDLAYRENTQPNGPHNKTIFYHIHNPNTFERAHFLYHYPKAKMLTIMRHPIQMLESWMTIDKIRINAFTEENDMWSKTTNAGNKIISLILHLHNPLTTMAEARGVKLEDIKRNPKKTLPAIANWIGVEDHSSLYKSEFLNRQYSRPSASFDNITGFDTRSIDVPLGRVFNQKEIQILETLFWPVMKTYNYTDMTKQQFQKNLKVIRPWLNEPFQFEKDIYDTTSKKDTPLKEMDTYKALHQHLINAWETLDNTGTYPHIITPLSLGAQQLQGGRSL